MNRFSLSLLCITCASGREMCLTLLSCWCQYRCLFHEVHKKNTGNDWSFLLFFVSSFNLRVSYRLVRHRTLRLFLFEKPWDNWTSFTLATKKERRERENQFDDIDASIQGSIYPLIHWLSVHSTLFMSFSPLSPHSSTQFFFLFSSFFFFLHPLQWLLH